MAHQKERHFTRRIGWLRAAVLGANDGIVSTSSLLLGVAASQSGRGAVLVAGVAGLVAGAMSMAAGEFVSVRSQEDVEKADLERERRELLAEPEAELQELASIYEARGVAPELAVQVARQLMMHDALGAHAADELGLSKHLAARPLQAALASAASFATGGALPLAVATLSPWTLLVPLVAGASLVFLAVLGALSAGGGGARLLPATLRVAGWGALAMALTAGAGALFKAL